MKQTSTKLPRSFAALFTHILSGLTPEQIAAGGPLLAIELLAAVARALAALRITVAGSPVPFDGGAADILGAIADRCRGAIVTLAAMERGGVMIPAVLDGPAARDALLAFVSLSRAAELEDDPGAPPGVESLAGIRTFALDCSEQIATVAADRAEMKRAAKMDLFGEMPPASRSAGELLRDLAYTAREKGDTAAADNLTAAAKDGAHLRALTDALPGAVLAAIDTWSTGVDIGEAYRRAMPGLPRPETSTSEEPPEPPSPPPAPFAPGDVDDDDRAGLDGREEPSAVLASFRTLARVKDPAARRRIVSGYRAQIETRCGLTREASYDLFRDDDTRRRLRFSLADLDAAEKGGAS